MFSVSDHVVCVNGRFPVGIEKFYTALPREGSTYVIRDIRLGARFNGEGDVSLLLVGVVNPRADSKAGHERGFSQDRFKPLEEMTTTTTNVKVDELVNA